MKKIISFICIVLSLSVMVTPVSAAKKDTKAPVITRTDPADCTGDIMIEDDIVIRFSESVRKGKNITKISLKESDLIAVGFTYELKDHLLKITPKAKLKYDTIYTVTIPASAVKDASGNNFAKSYVLTFITEEDPSKAADTAQKPEKFKYILEIEAAFDKELTKDRITYFTDLMKMFGIDAAFLNIFEADGADQKSAQGTASGSGDQGKNTSGTEYSSYILLLKDPGPDKVRTIKTISSVTAVTLSEAEKLTDGAPVILQKNMTLEQAETAKQELEASNASVSLIGIE